MSRAKLITACLVLATLLSACAPDTQRHRAKVANVPPTTSPALPPIAWDFQRSIDCASIGWTPDRAHEQHLAFQGERFASVRMPDGRPLTIKVSLAELFERDGRVIGVTLYSPLLDLDDAHATASKLLDDWGLANVTVPDSTHANAKSASVRLSEWEARASANAQDNSDAIFSWDGAAHRDANGLELRVSVTDAQGPGTRRYCVILTADWREMAAATKPPTP